MKNLREKFANKFPRFTAFIIKAHLNYLFMALLLYGFKAALYFLIAKIPNDRIATFDMAIDSQIPFIKYFYVFYLSYYFLPEIFIWILSFFDKRKVTALVLGGIAANILCCICFLIYQVKMIRPDGLNPGWEGYPEYEHTEVSVFAANIHDFSSFFDFLIAFQYHADDTALNCFPSLHAVFGTVLFLVGIPLTKREVKLEKKLPLWLAIFAGVFGMGIVVSTFFVKQHYFVDAVAGMAIMIGMYYLADFFIGRYLKKKALNNENVAEEKLEVQE